MTREEALRIIKECKEKGFKHTFYTLNEYHTALDIAIKALEQEPCEDEYIKVPKKALKYRTSGMVAYNAEWLKNNFDIERTVICGEQEPVLDKIRADIERIEICGQIDGHSAFIRSGENVKTMALDIIEKYKAESEEV